MNVLPFALLNLILNDLDRFVANLGLVVIWLIFLTLHQSVHFESLRRVRTQPIYGTLLLLQLVHRGLSADPILTRL